MCNSVFVLLDVLEGKVDLVAQILRSKAGVKMVYVLEGPPDVIIRIQAQDRERLASLTNQTLASIESETECWQILPARNGCNMLLMNKQETNIKSSVHADKFNSRAGFE